LGGSGDPSILTSYGLFAAMRAAAREAWGDPSLAGKRVAIQGVGKVGSGLARHVLDAGASVVVADVDASAVGRLAEELDVEAVHADAILATECDVLSPCALGGALNDRTIPDLRCRVVCGAANNQLERPEHGEAIAARGIVYAPDFVVNAGGIINISEEFVPGGYDAERARRSVSRIEDTLTTVFRLARERNLTPAAAADRMAEERLRGARADGLEAAAQ